MAKAKSRCGHSALLSNEIKDPIAALQIYGNKDVGEKAFSDIKGGQICRSPLVSSELILDGKPLAGFIARIVLFYIRKHMQNAGLFGKYTFQGLPDEPDVIELLEVPGKDPIFGEAFGRQVKIYETIDVPTPKSASL